MSSGGEGCPSGKASWTRREGAESMIEKIAQKSADKIPAKRPHSAYRCPTCGLWHITAQTAEERAARKAKAARQNEILRRGREILRQRAAIETAGQTEGENR